MFSFLKKNKDKDNQVVENSEVSENFFSKAFSKTFASIKSVVPQKKEKISFEEIEEILIYADVESTIIAKLAAKLKKEGQSVILGAGDTFRAAAIEQLTSWANKPDIPIIKTKQGHDSSAVAYNTICSAIARNIDNVIIDTAGRLQTQSNLKKELKKIVKVCEKALENRPYQKLMILDGTQGNSAIAQAKAFNEIVGIDGIIVTKLDGTAKGGALFSISNQLELPIFYIGVGEKQDDLIEFSPDYFVDSLLDEIYIKD